MPTKTNKKDFADYPANLSATGACITIGSSKPKFWWDIFCEEYYKPCEDDDSDDPSCHWVDNEAGDKTITDTVIKYSNSELNLTVTITIFFTTGSITVQGKKKCLEIWLNDHYPRLEKLYLENVRSPERNVCLSKGEIDQNDELAVNNASKKDEELSDGDGELNKTIVRNFLNGSPKCTSSPLQKIQLVLQNNSFLPRRRLIENKEMSNSDLSTTAIGNQEYQTVSSGESHLVGDETYTPIVNNLSRSDQSEIPRTSPSGDSTKPEDEKKTDDKKNDTKGITNAEPRRDSLPPKIIEMDTPGKIAKPGKALSLSDVHTQTPSQPKKPNNLSCEILKNITENIEDSVEQYMETNDSRIKRLEDQISSLNATIETLTETCKSLRNQSDDIEAKNMKIKHQKDKISHLRSENDDYRTQLHQQNQEIAVLKCHLQHAETMAKCREDFDEKLQVTVSNLKLDFEQQMKKTQIPMNCNTNVVTAAVNKEVSPVEDENKLRKESVGVDSKGDKVDVGSETKDDNKEDIDSETKEDNKEDGGDNNMNVVRPKKLLVRRGHNNEKPVHVGKENIEIKSKYLLLMDSNRRFLQSQCIGDGDVTIIKTSTAAEILGVVSVLDLKQTKHIMISSGTNDTDKKDVDEIVQILVDAARQIQTMYPGINVYISDLLPRKELAQRETRQINAKLNELLPETIHRIRHSNLNATHMHDDKHVSKKYMDIIESNINEVLDKMENNEDVRKQRDVNMRYENNNSHHASQTSKHISRDEISEDEDIPDRGEVPSNRNYGDRERKSVKKKNSRNGFRRSDEENDERTRKFRGMDGPRNGIRWSDEENGERMRKFRGMDVPRNVNETRERNGPHPNMKIIGKIMESLLYQY